MSLKTVTITGADDSTSLKELIELSDEFPFVEWGILVSWSSEGHYRFPSRKWVEEFVEVSKKYIGGLYAEDECTTCLEKRTLAYIWQDSYGRIVAQFCAAHSLHMVDGQKIETDHTTKLI